MAAEQMQKSCTQNFASFQDLVAHLTEQRAKWFYEFGRVPSIVYLGRRELRLVASAVENLTPVPFWIFWTEERLLCSMAVIPVELDSHLGIGL